MKFPSQMKLILPSLNTCNFIMNKVILETENKITLSQKHPIDKKIHNSTDWRETLKVALPSHGLVI